MKRIHSSGSKNLIVHSVAQFGPRYDYKLATKPLGLWYGINNAWLDWCRAEMPEWLKRYKYHYHIDLDTSKILNLSTLEETLAFHQKYGVDHSKHFLPKHIDWQKVAQDYSGIEINPYKYNMAFQHFEKHEEMMWYYCWDMASGCIWNKTAIKNIELQEA